MSSKREQKLVQINKKKSDGILTDTFISQGVFGLSAFSFSTKKCMHKVYHDHLIML